MKNKGLIFTAFLLINMAMLTACGSSADSQEEKGSDITVTEQEVPADGSSENDADEVSGEDNGESPETAEKVEDKGDLYYDVQKNTAVMDYEGDNNSAFMQPILQNPTSDTVTVQWFTEEEGSVNEVYLYESQKGEDTEDADTGQSQDEDSLTGAALQISDETPPTRTIEAKTTVMSRLRGGKTEADMNDPTVHTTIYKHVAVVDKLPEYHGYLSERVNYRIVTDDSKSQVYSLAAAPAEGTPMRILLTSDLQIKDMCASNYQKVYEAVGNVDAILCDGDLVDVADRVYDWFYADNAFWRVMTGTACDDVNGNSYYGGPLVQYAPIYTAIGNHDVMGVYDETTDLSVQFNNPSTRENAENEWTEAYNDGNGDLKEADHDTYVLNHSYNTISYEEMFELPTSASGGEKYYAVSLGDVRLITLDISRIWRLTAIGGLGKYSEVPGADEKDYGFGDFIFEPITEGSDQLAFLKEELADDRYKNAGIRLTMFHCEAHSLGDNQAPAFTDPVASTVTDPQTGREMTVYTYPLSEDYINTIVEPLLTESGTNLLFEAHSHLWNRFKTQSGMNVLETSNVGNSYGAYMGDKTRSTVPSVFKGDETYTAIAGSWNAEDYPLTGDPYGLDPIEPNVTGLPDGTPYLDSNTITSFSILDTGKGTVDSYYYDTENPDGGVILFDSFEVTD